MVYLVAMGGLLMPLFWLSQPATRGHGHREAGRAASWPSSATQYHLSQTDLGQIDPTTETIRLATLGMRRHRRRPALVARPTSTR